MKNFKFHFDSAGQSLLEVIVAVGLVSVTLSGMLMLMTRSVQFVEVSYNRQNAIRIVKQKLEDFRIRRDEYIYGFKDNVTSIGGDKYWKGFKDECDNYTDLSPSEGTTLVFDTGKADCPTNPSPSPQTKDPNCTTIPLNSFTYTWKVTCKTNPSNQNLLNITATVDWTDFKGKHTLSNTTALSNWK